MQTLEPLLNAERSKRRTREKPAAQPANGADASALRASAPLIGALGLTIGATLDWNALKEIGTEFKRMATNKNQHFVPRCYLRPFSKASAGKIINLFNIDRDLFINEAPLKHQCSKSYFYGNDALLEEAIQIIEGEYASAVSTISHPPFKLTDDVRLVLRRFWLLQYLRTEAACTRAAEMMSGMGDYVGIKSEALRMEIRDAVLTAMRMYAEQMEVVDDLKVCIVRNKSETPFVTSDDPAVLTNPWQIRDARTKPWSFGLRSAGALFMLPLAPTLAAIGYDGDVYSIPHKNGYLETADPRDVTALNEHQFLTCRANIFVSDGVDPKLIREAYASIAPNRPPTRHRYNYAVLDPVHHEYKRYVQADPMATEKTGEAIVHMQVIHPRPSSWPRFISIRRTGRVFSNGTGVGYVRHAEIEVSGNRGFVMEKP